MSAGHGGISGRYERWKEAAFQYAWLLDTAKANHEGGAYEDDLLDRSYGSRVVIDFGGFGIRDA